MAELAPKLRELHSLDPRQHWFCGDVDATVVSPLPGQETDRTDPPPTPYPRNALVTLDIHCLKLFAYTTPDVEEPLQQLIQGIDRQLGKCGKCILAYYRIREELINQLREEYDDADVEVLSGIIHEQELTRIRRGLQGAAAVLRNISVERRSVSLLTTTQRYAITEALSCERFLLNEDAVQDGFVPAFGDLVDKHELGIRHYLPSMAIFLFRSNATLRNWAHQTLDGIQGPMNKSEFDFAIRGPLAWVLPRAATPPYDAGLARLLWSGLHRIVGHLDQDMITHCLRSLEIDIYRLALEHLQIEDESLRFILQTLRALLVTSPKDLWDAMGAISPVTVAEQILRSPMLDNIMLNAASGESNDATSSLSDMVSWIEPFMHSLQIGNQPTVARSIVDQILSRVRSNSVGPEARIACWREATRLLAQVLAGCNKSTSLSDAVGRVVATDALALGNAYMDDLLDILDQPHEDSQARTLAANCIVIVHAALALECKILYGDRVAVANGKHTGPVSSIHAPDTWRKITRNLNQDNVNLARSILGGTSDLFYLEQIRSKGEQPSPKEEAINKNLEDLFGCAGRAVEKMNYFTPRCLREMIQYPATNANLLVTAISIDQTVHDSAVELMKSATFDSFRRDAIRSLLITSLKEPLNALNEAIRLVCYVESFGPCPHLLRICADITFSLCDTQVGILRNKSLDGPAINAVTAFWEAQWRALKMMSECSERWNLSRAAEREALREFVRDVMQSAETLFDQFNVFNNVIAENGTQQSESQPKSGAGELLRHPSEATEGITRYLRLKDEYLLRTSVEVIRKLLAVLTTHNLKLPAKTTNFLTEVAIWNNSKDPAKKFGTKTLLLGTELAGIAQDLENNAGSDIVQQARDVAMIERGMIPDAKQETPPAEKLPPHVPEGSLPIQSKKKQATIDLTGWGIKAESTRDVERKPPLVTQKPATQQVKQANQSTGVFDRSGLPKHAPPKSGEAQKAFLSERKKAKMEAERRKADEIARIKKGIPGLIANQTANEGSALHGIGDQGKDHTPKVDTMMVSSDSESAPSDDDFDQKLFGGDKSKPTRRAVDDLPLITAPSKPRGPVKKARIQRSTRDLRARLAPPMTGLFAKLLSWDFFHAGDFPPGSSREDFSAVKDTFRSTTEYKRSFESLLLLEAWSSFSKAREEAVFRVFEVKVANRISVDSLFEVNATVDAATFKEVGVMEADILVLSTEAKPHESPNKPHCLGRISKTRFKKASVDVTIQIASGSNVGWVTQGVSLFAVKLESITTLEREYGALYGLEYYDLCQEIIKAEVSPILKHPEQNLQSIMKIYKLNLAQAKAVQSAIDNDAFTLIQGPPGSGKTKTIVAIVGALLTQSLRTKDSVRIEKNGHSQSTPYAKKLLVCAPSNAAVDELVMRFMQGVKTSDGLYCKPNVLRLGRSEKVNPQVLSVTLDERIQKIINPLGEKVAKEESELEKAINAHKIADAKLKEMYDLFDESRQKGTQTTHEQSKRFETLKSQKQSWSTRIERLRDSGNTAGRDVDIRRRQAEQKVLNEAQIICATLSGSARETFQHLTVDFDSVVIDEAAQCIELSALIPLKYGCAKCIMVGDPKQLPPTVLSREASRFQYEQSLFVRMQRNQPEDIHLLDTQYRMHPAISRFPSRVFYDDRLLDGPDMAKLRTQAWHKDPLLGPYRFFDVAGRSTNAPKGHSLINIAEVEAALELYRRLIQSVRGYDFTGKIGVITPYKSQLRLLGDRFTKVHGPNITKTIEFNTTDAFQGRESEVIIFSCVRASDRGIGFLADIRRMNVGITRARSSLWVLGNSQALMQGEFWRKLVTDAKDRQLFEGGNVMKTIREMPKVIVEAKGTNNPEGPENGPNPDRFNSPLTSPEMPLQQNASSRRKSVSSATTSSLDDSESDDAEEIGKTAGNIPQRVQSQRIEGEDVVMSDAQSLSRLSETASGTNTPKRKRSDSPDEKRQDAVETKRTKEGNGQGKEVPNAPIGPKADRKANAPPLPRPRKPAGEEALFIKPKRKK